MLTLLAALLLWGPLPARAEGDPAAAAAPETADTDGDGTVSGKERRQKRRAERRARRGQRGPDGELLPDGEADAAEAEESSARGAAASSRAAGAAAALKSSLPSADAGAFPGGGSPAALGGQAATGGRTSDAGTRASSGGSQTNPAKAPSGDPGKPNAPSDFVLAARSGYEPAFAAAGLKLGPDGRSVVRLDGRPATEEDYSRLRREIGSMPAALGRRPDFFSAVSPAQYADLKRGYKEKKDGDTVYKDVGTTPEDRDFVHTASCDKLSGDCNKNVVKASYKKGDFVAPEDLDSMWDALQKELDGSAEAGGLPSLAATRSDISRAAAMDAARALSEEPLGDDAVRSAAGEGPAPRPTAVSEAVASVQRLWKSASTSIGGPGTAGAAGRSSAPPLALGALAFAALGAGALFMRRKG